MPVLDDDDEPMDERLKEIDEAMDGLMEMTSPRTVWILVEWIHATFPQDEWVARLRSFRDMARRVISS
jgi:hypothetical protein